ncbi:MAG TPA: hypothetical protein VMX16_05795 [Terriglobia bacterium]|nr:hypothetical protein [Terriglobia bacterium]
MKLLTRKASSFSRSNPLESACRRYHPEKGYALIAMMIMATVLLISLAAVLPGVYQEAQREKEQELIFRGNQYARAVYLFHNQLGRYPVSVKELLSTNSMRFLRQAYRDPMTPSGKWRFIHATAAGIPIDSRTQILTPQNPVNPLGSPASPSTPTATGGFGASSSSPGFGSSATPGPSSTTTPTNGQPNAQKPSPDCQNSQVLNTSPTTAESSPILGTFIVGVASCSDHMSIMTYNKKNQYSDWEFLGTTYIVTGIPGTVAPPTIQNPGQPTTPGQGGPGTGLGSPTGGGLSPSSSQ